MLDVRNVCTSCFRQKLTSAAANALVAHRISDLLSASPESVEVAKGLLAETAIDRKYRPTFPDYLKELDGKQVTVSGFIQPLREDPEMAAFMLIEYPVGCWYCEMPDVIGIVFVELPTGQSFTYTRGLVRVVGRLALNATDQEDFLYAVRKARVAEAD